MSGYRGGIFIKKILSLILSLCIFASFGMNAMAAGVCDYSDSGLTTSESETPSVTPRYKYLAFVTATIGEKPSDNVICSSTYNCMYNGYTFTLTCTLQRADGSETGWVNYKSASQSYTGMGAHGIEKIWYAPAGYAYRTLTTIVIKNASGTIVEQETCRSTVIYK